MKVWCVSTGGDVGWYLERIFNSEDKARAWIKTRVTPRLYVIKEMVVE